MNNFTVFMIVHNEEKRLGKLIPYLKSFGLDIFVVNQGSTDNTGKLLNDYSIPNIKTIKAGYSECDRYCLRTNVVKNDYILYLDADETPSEKLIKTLQEKELKLDSYSIKFLMDGAEFRNHRLHRFFNRWCVEIKPWLHSKFIPLKYAKSGPILDDECFIDARHVGEEISVGIKELNGIHDKTASINPFWLNANMPKSSSIEQISEFNRTYDPEFAMRCAHLFGRYSSVLYIGGDKCDFAYRDFFESQCLYCHGYVGNIDAPYITKTCASLALKDLRGIYDWGFADHPYFDKYMESYYVGASNIVSTYESKYLSEVFQRDKISEKILDKPGVFVYKG